MIAARGLLPVGDSLACRNALGTAVAPVAILATILAAIIPTCR